MKLSEKSIIALREILKELPVIKTFIAIYEKLSDEADSRSASSKTDKILSEMTAIKISNQRIEDKQNELRMMNDWVSKVIF